MKTLRSTAILFSCFLIVALMLIGPARADTDPTTHQIYAAAESGHLAQAQQMVQQVLRDHPRSAKAHYVAAELYARAGDLKTGRQELRTAESLEPGLAFAKPESVRALQEQFSRAGSGESLSLPPRRSLPLLAILAVVAAVGLWLALRRRSPVGYFPQYAGGVAPPSTMPTGASVAPTANTGMGSGIMGGLATGLAAGAGVVAGEAIAQHLIDADHPVSVVPAAVKGNSTDPENGDMGGSDFGVTDGDSWDDDGTKSDDGDWN